MSKRKRPINGSPINGPPIYGHEFYFNREQPFRTFYHFFDHEQKNILLAGFLYLFKHSPVWAIPVVTGNVINALSSAAAASDLADKSVDSIIINLIVLTILVFQNILTHTLFIYFLARAVREIEASLRLSIVRKLQQLAVTFHDRTNSGAIQSKVLRDVESVRNLIMLGMNAFIPAVVSFIFAFTLTLVKQPIISLVYLAAIPLIILLMRLFRGRLQKTNNLLRRNMEEMSADITGMIEMLPVTKAHGLEETEINRLERKFAYIHTNGLKLDTEGAIFGSMNWVGFQFLQVLCLAATVPLAIKGRIGPGDVVLFQGLFNSVLGAVSTILNIYPEISRGLEAINSIGDILEAPDIEENEGKERVCSVKGDIEFRNITFSYPGTALHALTGINIRVECGQCAAFVGESGSGKSTMMQLIMGLRRAERGQVLVDGRDMAGLDLRTYRHFISVVPQEVVLFPGSIRENIGYGLKGVSDDRIREAAAMANALEFIEKLPQGFETPIGERGTRLSGGQRQRIAIARALIRDPRILILDEATSALDVVSEKLVQDAITSLIRGRTAFIVAHRLSTIRNADMVVVLEGGRIVESGSYAELAGRGGQFSRLRAMS